MSKTEHDVDPAFAAFLRAKGIDANELAEFNAKRDEANELIAKLKGDAVLFNLVDAGLAGTEITHTTPTAGKPGRPPKAAKATAAKKGSQGFWGDFEPHKASLDELKAAKAEAESKGANRKVSALTKLIAERLVAADAAASGGGKVVDATAALKAGKPAEKPAKVAKPAGEKKPLAQRGWQGRAGGEPTSITDAKNRLRTAKSADMRARLETWIAERSGTAHAAGSRATAARGFGRGSGGSATAPQRSAEA